MDFKPGGNKILKFSSSLNKKTRERNKTPLGTKMTEAAMSVWQPYFDIFKRRWGIDGAVAEHIGQTAADVFEAEFAEHGSTAYSTSVVLPIRNSTYQAFMVEWRWHWLREMGIMSPVLDYGCGVGLLLLWLHRKGYKDLYGYELPGVQQNIMAEVFKDNGINVWDGKRTGFNTILCLNVLEHVEHPLTLLEKLYGLGKRVIADVCIDDADKIQGPHIAPHDELVECGKILTERRGLYTHEGPRRKHGLRSAL